MRKYLAFAICVLTVNVSCNMQKTDVETIDLPPAFSINILNDSSYFSPSSSCLTVVNDRVYFSDAQRSQIIVLDTNLDLINEIGKQGKGPQELLGAVFFAVYKDTVVVSDPGNDRIQFYETNGNHIKTLDALKKMPSKFHKRFIYLDGIFTADSHLDCAMARFSGENSNDITKIGQKYQFNSAKQSAIRNNRNVLQHNDCLITISDNMPYIEKYDAAGTLVQQYDLCEIPIIKSIIETMATQSSDENSYFNLVTDCQIFEDNLIILCHEFRQEHCYPLFIQFDISSSITPVRIMNLPTDAVYQSFSFDNDYIYTYNNTDNEIEKIKL